MTLPHSSKQTKSDFIISGKEEIADTDHDFKEVNNKIDIVEYGLQQPLPARQMQHLSLVVDIFLPLD